MTATDSVTIENATAYSVTSVTFFVLVATPANAANLGLCKVFYAIDMSSFFRNVRPIFYNFFAVIVFFFV